MRFCNGILACVLLNIFITSCFAADQKVIYMALFRGVTEAEQGFMDYLNSQVGLDVTYVFADAESDRENVANFPEDIRRIKPDLIYTFGTTVTLTIAGTEADANANDNITDIPIVFNIVADPVGAGLVNQMNNPSGRNLTGTSHLVPIPTQVNAIQELGEFKHIGVLYNANEQNSILQVKNIQQVIESGTTGMDITSFAIDSDVDPAVAIRQAVSRAGDMNVDILYLPSDSYLIANGELIAVAASAEQIPIFSATDGPVQAGHALAGLVSKYYLVGQFAGFKALQILQGAQVSEVPIETLTKFNTVINLDMADKVDYYPPVNLLLNATLYRE